MIYGNINSISLVEAWNDHKRHQFSIMNLLGEINKNHMCSTCFRPANVMYSEDFLWGYEDIILARLEDLK